MARLSNVSGGITEVGGHKARSLTTYGRKKRPHVYNLLSPRKKSQSARSWTPINEGRDTQQTEDTRTPLNGIQKTAAQGSLASTLVPRRLRKSTEGNLGFLMPRVQSTHSPTLQPHMASNKSPVRSSVKPPLQPTVETLSEHEFSLLDIITEVTFTDFCTQIR
jgi:hypothetical protein